MTATRTPVAWHLKIEQHNNLALVHTRGEEAQDVVEDSGLVVSRFGTSYTLKASDTHILTTLAHQAGLTIIN